MPIPKPDSRVHAPAVLMATLLHLVVNCTVALQNIECLVYIDFPVVVC
jgi:hypothetical protein